MWHLTTELPNKCIVAVSGGADSMAALHFITRNRKRKVGAAIFDHNTGFHKESYPLVKDYCCKNNIELTEGSIKNEKPPHKSWEEYWRDERYSFLFSLFSNIITGHNLDDVVETYLWSTLNGNPKIIPCRRQCLLRPFLAVKHDDMVEYCKKNKVPFINDKSNKDPKYKRTRLRYEMKPLGLSIQPGLYSCVKRLVLNENNSRI